ncbi:Late competence protein ComGB, access of DNA to ComEA [Streptococcus sp. DD10]|nr:Late competence protein ComGB, access of DNA to ComEA [Streptococcus sp. DD10]
MFNNLFSSGFHLAEIVDFLGKSRLLDQSYVDKMHGGLSLGQSFSDIMDNLGFSESVITQLSLAELHGNLQLSLLKLEDYLDQMSKVKKKLIEVGTYPIILLGFLVLIMLGLRNYLLPQLDSHNIATQLISIFPQLFMGTLVLILLGSIFSLFFIRRLSRIRFMTLLARLPFLSQYVKNYLTAYYAGEWGSMMEQGLELSQIFQLMQTQKSQLFREIGQDMEEALQKGQSFSKKIATYPFFTEELALFIEYGEVKSKLGRELAVYSEKTWENFFYRVNRAMNLIQPLVFVFVALVIVLLYAAMLLPIYQSMEVSL